MINSKIIIKVNYWGQLFRLSIAQVLIIACSYFINKEHDYVTFPEVNSFVLSTGFMISLSFLSRDIFCNHFIKRIFFGGIFPAIVLSLTGRIGIWVGYMVISPNIKYDMSIQIFSDCWSYYLWMILLGIVCMSIDPITRIIKNKHFDKTDLNTK